MRERLQKIISAAGVASRRAAERLIEDGTVTVNGETAVLGQSADIETDIICVNGRQIEIEAERSYIMLNKPRGYVTTMSDEHGRKTVRELTESAGKRLYPVGRLDLDTEGLLILTDDGELANALMHPSHEVEKVYEVTVSGEDIDASLAVLRSALVIDGYKIKPAKAEIVSSARQSTVLHITISEGRNRQVRKMCDAANLRVIRLRRISEGTLSLGTLPTGKWRYLEKNEIELMKKIIFPPSER